MSIQMSTCRVPSTVGRWGTVGPKLPLFEWLKINRSFNNTGAPPRVAIHGLAAPVVALTLALVAILCRPINGTAQVREPSNLPEAGSSISKEAGRIVEKSSLSPLSSEEKASIEKSALSDAHVRTIVGSGKTRVITAEVEVDKAEAEAFLAGTSATPPTRRVTVFVFNADTNKAAKALLSPAENRVLTVQSIKPADVPLVSDDAVEALALAKADSAVRRAIGDSLDRFEVLPPGNEAHLSFAAQALPLRSSNPRDPCSRDRCLDLIFRTESGYLPLRVQVDLTKRSVTVPKGEAHR